MRLPARKLYRAFHELDCFSDEQCEAFVGAANRGKGRRRTRIHLQLVAAVTAFGAVVLAFERACRSSGADPWDLRSGVISDGMLAAVAGIGFGVGSLAWLVARDWLIRTRMRRVINTRGSCAKCGYSLTGLPLPTGQTVTCPECAWELAADKSLGEVVTVGAGVERFMPSPEVIPPILRWLTPRRKKMIVRLSIGIPCGIALLTLLGWGGYEWFLRWQAGVAAAERQNAAALSDLVEMQQPKDTDEHAPDAWESFDAAVGAMAAVDDRTWQPRMSNNPHPIYSLDSPAVSSPTSETDSSNAQYWASERALALKLIEDYRAAGVYAHLDEMAKRRRAVRPFSPTPPAEALGNSVLPPVHQIHLIARINGARMKLAVTSGDLTEFASAAEANLALLRILHLQPFLLDRLVACALEGMTLDRIRAVLATQPSVEWVEAIDAAIERQRDAVPFDAALASERIEQLDLVAWLFSSPGRVRWGPFTPLIAGPAPEQSEAKRLPLGTYTANREAMEKTFDTITSDVRREAWGRRADPDPVLPRLLLVRMQLDGLRRLTFVADQERLNRRGLHVMVALERFRCDQRSYPESLDALVPRYLTMLPNDPWSGRPFGYRRLESRSDGRPAYVLYSVGADGIDDGGNRAPKGQEIEAIRGNAPGTDLVISPDSTNGPRQ